MANVLAATVSGPEFFKVTRVTRNQKVAVRSMMITRVLKTNFPTGGGAEKEPTRGQIFPR